MIVVDKDLLELLAYEEIKIISADETLPFDPTVQVGPASIDLRLGLGLRRYKAGMPIHLAASESTELVELKPDQEFEIKPNEFWLASTLETVMVPPHLAGFLTGRSSVARLGLLVHCSQEFIQPGYADTLPLQLVNLTDRPITIRPYLRICQLILVRASSGSQVPYFSRVEAKYKDLTTYPEPSRIGIELGLEQSQLLGKSHPDHRLEQEQEEWRDKVDKLSVTGESLFERIRKLEERNNGSSSGDHEIIDFLKIFIGSPLVSDIAERSSFREDVAMNLVKEAILRDTPRRVNVLDACCGLGSWIKLAPSSLGKQALNLVYVGVDNSAESVRLLENVSRTFSSHVASFKCYVRDLLDIDDLPGRPFDLIFLHNTLHELCPSIIGRMLAIFAKLLQPQRGILSIVDMEKLPPNEPEANAVTWSAAEIQQILSVAGFEAVHSTHQKKVAVYHVYAMSGRNGVDEMAVNRAIRGLLQRKLAKFIHDRQDIPAPPRWGSPDIYNWLLSCGAIARHAEVIARIDSQLHDRAEF